MKTHAFVMTIFMVAAVFAQEPSRVSIDIRNSKSTPKLTANLDAGVTLHLTGMGSKPLTWMMIDNLTIETKKLPAGLDTVALTVFSDGRIYSGEGVELGKLNEWSKRSILVTFTIDKKDYSFVVEHDGAETRSASPTGMQPAVLLRTPVYDAIALSKAVKEKDKTAAFEVLRKYFPIPTPAELNPAITDNGILANAIEQCTITKDIGRPTSDERGAAAQSERNAFSLGIPGAPVVADALTKFVIKRAKEEINASFIADMQEAFRKNPWMQVLFPQTHDFVLRFDSYRYISVVQILKESFEEDMRDLPTHLPQYLLTVGRNQSATLTDAQKEIIGSVALIYSFVSGGNPAEIIENLNPGTIGGGRTNLVSSILLMKIFSRSLRDNGTDRAWVQSSKMAELLSNENTVLLFLALVMEDPDMDKVAFQGRNGMPVKLRDKFLSSSNRYSQAGESLRAMHDAILVIQNQIRIIRAAAGQGAKASYQAYYDLFNAVVDLCGGAQSFVVAVQPDVDTSRFAAVLKIARKVTGIYRNVNEGDYGAALQNALIVVDEFVPDGMTKSELLKYGAFIATAGQAKDADEFEAAIEAAALPVGSARIKKHSAFSVALNSYVGFHYSAEALSLDRLEDQQSSYGLYLPIGVTFSWPMDLCFIKSFSIFPTLLDLGAVGSYRLSDDSTKLPDFTWENILAPGVHFMFGLFDNYPMTLGIDIQVSPQLRRISAERTFLEPRRFRFGLSLSMDIPLLNFQAAPVK
jgi:hypothetical protein